MMSWVEAKEEHAFLYGCVYVYSYIAAHTHIYIHIHTHIYIQKRDLLQVGSKLQVVLLPRENQDGVLKKLKDCTCFVCVCVCDVCHIYVCMSVRVYIGHPRYWSLNIEGEPNIYSIYHMNTYTHPHTHAGDLWGPLLVCLTLSILLSITAPEDQGALVFAAVFFVVWFGAAVVTLNAQLLGGTM